MKDKKEKYVKIILVSICVLLIIFFMIKNRHIMRQHIRIRDIKRFILSYGKFSSLCFVIVYGLKPIIFIVPASLLSILAGNIFGPYMGLFLSMIGCFFSGSLAFVLSKLLGRSFVEKILKGRALNLDQNIERHGFKIMLLMRLSFVFPYDPLSYAAGLSKMKYSDFILGTMLGILPEMLAYSFMGENIERPLSAKFVFPIVFIIAVALLGSYTYKIYKGKQR